MDLQEIFQKIRKNSVLVKSEKDELIAFWAEYRCPVAEDVKLQANYHDGEIKEYTVENRLNKFYDETPFFIEQFFKAMSEGKEFTTRFATYKPLNVS